MKMTALLLICLAVAPLAVYSTAPCADHCNRCAVAGRGKCDENSCEARYTRNRHLQCIPCSAANCTTCSPENVNECLPGKCDRGFYFYFKKGICIPCSSNCENCPQQYCILCKKGFYEFNGKCKPCREENCQSCPWVTEESRDKCKICSPGFGKNETGTCNVTCKPGCSCSVDNTCETCLDLYKTSEDTCKPCPEGCKKCSIRDGYCNPESCEVGYTEIEYGGYSSCVLCHAACMDCRGASGPDQCDSGHCGPGTRYDIESKTCVACAEGCDRCTSSSVCDNAFCANGWTPEPEGLRCLRCHPLCQVGQCSDQNKCKPNQCLPGAAFVSSSHTCIPCPHKCKTCNEAMGNMCDDDGCFKSYYLDSTTHECTACPPGCLRCSSATVCKVDQCAKGFSYDEETGTCDACATMKTPDSGSCGASCSIPHCKTCETEPECDACAEGYYRENSTHCEPCDRACATCSNKTICTTCAPDHYYTESEEAGITCTLCAEHCLECYSAHSCKAGRCEEGFYMNIDDGGSCRPIACFGKVNNESSQMCSACPQGLTFDSRSNRCVTASTPDMRPAASSTTTTRATPNGGREGGNPGGDSNDNGVTASTTGGRVPSPATPSSRPASVSKAVSLHSSPISIAAFTLLSMKVIQ